MRNIVKLNPTVCAVKDMYQIMIVSEDEALISVHVGDNVYFSHSNGVKKSKPGVHRVCVPMQELDKARRYTVVAQKAIERLAYFPKFDSAVQKDYTFRPLEKTNDINIYHFADVHGELNQALNIAERFEKQIDLLVLNGDISSTSDTYEDVILCYKIASEVAKGEVPCIISRGNHDLRGPGAENLEKYMPGDNGKPYYTFKLGCIWGMLVDGGEDKIDHSPEYGGTICFHDFRLNETKEIENVIKNASCEYAQDDVKYKFIISHMPFTFRKKEPFNIEEDIYIKWAKLIKDNIKPDVMLCGHTHNTCISRCGGEYDALGQPCPIIVGSDLKIENGDTVVIAGALVNIADGKAKVTVRSENKVVFEGIVDF